MLAPSLHDLSKVQGKQVQEGSYENLIYAFFEGVGCNVVGWVLYVCMYVGMNVIVHLELISCF